MTTLNPPQPEAQGADAQYRVALNQGRFLIQRCTACKHAVFYPRMICPHCGAGDLTWEDADGRGEVYATTVVRRKPEAGGDYNVALIDLLEGVRIMSRVDDIAPDLVSIGMAVKARVEQQDGNGIVVFVPFNKDKQ